MPQAKIVEGYQPLMPTFQGLVSEENVMALVEYVKSLRAAEGAVSRAEAPAEPARPTARRLLPCASAVTAECVGLTRMLNPKPILSRQSKVAIVPKNEYQNVEYNVIAEASRVPKTNSGAVKRTRKPKNQIA